MGSHSLLIIGTETESMVSDDFKVLLLSENPASKLAFKLLEACFCSLEACWSWEPHLSSIMQFLPNIIGHILSWRWEDVILRKVDVGTTHRRLGSRCAVTLLATIHAI